MAAPAQTTASVRTGIATAPGRGPALETIQRANGYEVPFVVPIAVGAWDYRSGQQGAVILPEDGRLLAFSCMAGPSGATVQIDDGDEIPIPASMGFGISVEADVFNSTIVFTGTITYFVQFVMEGQA